MTSIWYRFVLGALVTWRVTHLLHAEDGPWKSIALARSAVSRIGVLRELFACFYCLSLWVAAPLAYLLGESWIDRLLLVPALSAVAILAERLTQQPPMPDYVEDPEVPDGMLWKESNDDEPRDRSPES